MALDPKIMTRVMHCPSVCRKCVEETDLSRSLSEDDEEIDDEFYCHVTSRIICNFHGNAPVQPDCPRLMDHLFEADVLWTNDEVQQILFDPDWGASSSPHRLEHGLRELVYLDIWRQLNKRSPGLNSGITYLEHILAPSDTASRYATQREAYVAASLVQWLGTNCGQSFLFECERRCKKVLTEKRTKDHIEFSKKMHKWRMDMVAKRLMQSA